MDAVPRHDVAAGYPMMGDWADLRRLALAAAEQAAWHSHLERDPQALSTFADLFVRSMLGDVADGQTDGRLRTPPGPMPAVLRRAYAYLNRHAEQQITLAEVAEAIGCSLRALQMAFRRFRDTTPAAALRRVRLDRARAEIIGSDAPVTAIARRFRFTNAGRFASMYMSEFGETPAKTRQKQRS